jgi:putative hemolysin
MAAMPHDTPLTKTLEVRLAESAAEVRAAQALRYRVFYDEMKATPSPENARDRLDVDAFDSVCDHLVVVDRERTCGAPCVVGTYRLMRRPVALAHFGFYSEQEFDLGALIDYPEEIVEVGRSCVDPDYRKRGVMQLLWRGIADYVAARGIRILFGCASFPGTEPDAVDASLSYLHHYHLAPRDLRPRARGDRYVAMARLPRSRLDEHAALGDLPPLVKGYVRLGGFVGDGAVVDHQFNTIDVCILVQTERLTGKYRRHYRPSGTP